MVVRVDKCSTFGIKKVLSKSAQYLPKLLINKDLIPTIKTVVVVVVAVYLHRRRRRLFCGTDTRLLVAHVAGIDCYNA
jgi:transcription initiation factor TFIIIB Brf1 subunit/transcription initiation factor TFIIB